MKKIAPRNKFFPFRIDTILERTQESRLCKSLLPLLPTTLYLVDTTSGDACWTAALKAYTASCINAGEGNSCRNQKITFQNCLH